ncbi:hypothetical protein [Mesorhizobium sp. BE184]|uniref:hypothetical protein n=1 Tax=Mesorhizobium sp. BE184 TaxID=2817714 RepID=UPI00286087AA|nr:hypothetical protein [Mesorhizobium sp. BE184]MDR7034522.1 hypothetical protein [Mesorhizobium sp. BE184]
MTKHVNSTALAGNPEAQTENAVSDLLRRTIARHEAAHAYFESTVYLSDDLILGRDATAEETAIWDVASDIEEAALTEVCFFPAFTAADMAAKARHLLKMNTQHHGELQGYQVDNLLLSMLPKCEHDNASLRAMIDDHKATADAINQTDADDPEVGGLCEKLNKAALAICGYRTVGGHEHRLKAKFLREWTKDTELTGEEQKALIASMLPEGGAA